MSSERRALVCMPARVCIPLECTTQPSSTVRLEFDEHTSRSYYSFVDCLSRFRNPFQCVIGRNSHLLHLSLGSYEVV